jgi:hypothetical protein
VSARQNQACATARLAPRRSRRRKGPSAAYRMR